MNRICQSIKVEMNADLSLRGCKINKITPKSANYCQVYCPNAQYMRIINTTWCYTCSVYHDEYYRKEGFFGLGQFGELTLHRPPMGGTPWPGLALRAVVWLFGNSSGCRAVIVSSFALCPGGRFKKLGL